MRENSTSLGKLQLSFFVRMYCICREKTVGSDAGATPWIHQLGDVFYRICTGVRQARCLWPVQPVKGFNRMRARHRFRQNRAYSCLRRARTIRSVRKLVPGAFQMGGGAGMGLRTSRACPRELVFSTPILENIFEVFLGHPLLRNVVGDRLLSLLRFH